MILIGKINADKFKSNIENNAKGTTESKGEEDFPMIVIVDGYTFEVQANGTIEEVKGLTIQSSVEMVKGQTKELTATLSKDITGEIKWNIEDGNVAELSTTTGNSTTITAKGEVGSSTKIIASIEVNGENITDECIVTIVSKVTAISVSGFEIETGEEKTIEVSTTPTENVEKLTYSYNVTSNPSCVTIDTDGKVKGISVGTATITITGVGESGTSVTATCTIIVKQPKLPIGEYVEYNVSYIDMYVADIDINTEGNQGFTASNGWRILDVETKNADGSYSGVKIISTGIPAKLYYNFQNPESWWGTEDQIKELYGSIQASKQAKNVCAATGLIKNFELLPLTANSSGIKTGNDFKTNKALELHNLTLIEMNNAINKINCNNDRKKDELDEFRNYDIFYLRGLKLFNFGNSAYPRYWYATPNLDNDNDLYYCYENGSVNDISMGDLGIRPVITLNSDIYKEGNIWKIK